MRRRLAYFFAAVVIAIGIFYAFTYLDHSSLKLAPSLPSPTVIATATPAPDASPTPSPVSYLPGQAFAQVQKFYSSYEQNASVLSQYVSPALAAQVNQSGAAAVFCAPDPPSSISYNPPVGSNDAATVGVNESFVSGSTVPVTVTVSLSNLAITAITCPNPQP